MIFGLLIWLGPILALIISIESRGPVFFVQKRTGFDNREFNCYKFRSMVTNISANSQQAGKNDARVTKIGKVLGLTKY